jgi:hypothetical protein
MAEEKRKNATIFTNNICDRLVELFEMEEPILSNKKHSAEANKRANEAWQRIVDTLNAEFPDTKLTKEQVQTKVKHLKAVAKKKTAEERKLVLKIKIFIKLH